MVNFPKRYLVIRSDSIVHKKRRSPVKKFAYFLIAGLAVAALQATTVEAQVGDPNMPPPVPADPMGTAVSPVSDPNMPPPMGDPNMPPPMGDPNMPPPVPADPMGTAMSPMDGEDLPPMDDADLEVLFAPPEGDEGDVPPLDDGSAPPAP